MEKSRFGEGDERNVPARYVDAEVAGVSYVRRRRKRRRDL